MERKKKLQNDAAKQCAEQKEQRHKKEIHMK